MRVLPLASLAVATVLAATAGCGGGGEKAATTTSEVPASFEESTTTLATTTSTTIDPALQALLLVKEDLPSGFEEQASQGGRPALFTTCDPTTAPAVKALEEASSAEGATFQRGTDGAVKVSSRAVAAAPDQAEPALSELTDAKVVECLESDLRAQVEKDQPAGSEVTLKLTAAKSTVKGADQTVLLSSTSTAKVDATTKTVRLDLVFLRRADTVLVVTYAGPSGLTSVAERQKIVAAAAAKLGGGASAGTSTTTEKARGSTSSSRRTSTTRRSTSSTRSSGTTSSSAVGSSSTSTTR